MSRIGGLAAQPNVADLLADYRLLLAALPPGLPDLAPPLPAPLPVPPIPLPTRPRPIPMAILNDRLRAGEVLRMGDRLTSPKRCYVCVLQPTDGNLVVYRAADFVALWGAGTGQDPAGAVFVAMQGDGNLVLFRNGLPVWGTMTEGYPGSRVQLQDDGNLVIVSGEEIALWGSGADPNPPPVPVYDVRPLHREGYWLVDDRGARQFLLGISGFTLLQVALDRDVSALEPFVDYMVASDIDIVRAFGMYAGGIGDFRPLHYGIPRVQGALDLVLGYLASRGRRLYLSTCADIPDALPADRIGDYFAALAEVGRQHSNLILGGGNEWGKNGWDPQALVRPVGVAASRGSGLGDEDPPAQPWDLADIHPDRTEFQRKFKMLWDERTGNTTSGVPFACPIWIDEPIGIGERDEPGRTTNDPEKIWDFIAGSRLWGDGVVLHTRCSITAVVPPATGSRTDQCVQAAREAVRQIEGWWKLAEYTRGPNANCPLTHNDALALRTYGLIDGNKALCLAVTPQPAWRAVAQGGWRIVEQRGARRNLVLCER